MSHLRTLQTTANKKPYKSLQKGQLFLDSEGFLLPIQDQEVVTRNYLKHIIKDYKKSEIDKETSSKHLSYNSYNNWPL